MGIKKPDYESASREEIIDYCRHLESCMNGASELIMELNLTSKVFADDLRYIRSGESGEATYIGKSDKNKKFEHTMTLYDKFDKIKALASYFRGAEIDKPQANPFEDKSKEYKKNGKTPTA